MIFLDYCFFRMYKAYEAKNDSPFLRSLIYISILQLFFLAVLFLYAKQIILRVSSTQELDFEKPIYIWSLAALLLLANYFYYSRLNIPELEKGFRNCVRLNSYVKLWMLIVFPFIFLLVGMVTYVFLFGGVILGSPIEGLFLLISPICI